jgi:hypothetical protein
MYDKVKNKIHLKFALRASYIVEVLRQNICHSSQVNHRPEKSKSWVTFSMAQNIGRGIEDRWGLNIPPTFEKSVGKTVFA